MSKCYSCTNARGGEVFMTEDCIARQHAPFPAPLKDVPRADFDVKQIALAQEEDGQDLDDQGNPRVHYYASGRAAAWRPLYDKARYELRKERADAPARQGSR